jgi:hypothetical protein
MDTWKKYNYCKDYKCSKCGVDFVWFEYIKVESDGKLINCGCPGNKEDVTKCPDFVIYKRETDIGMMLDIDSKK